MKLLICSVLILASVVIESQANVACPGATEASYGNGQIDCSVPPVCAAADGKLRPASDPTKFVRCTGKNLSVEMRCATGTCFSAESQACVHPWNWRDICSRAAPPTESPPVPTTQKPIVVTTVPSTPEETTTLPPAPTNVPELPSPTAPSSPEPTTVTEDPSTPEPTTITEDPSTPMPTTTTTTKAPVYPTATTEDPIITPWHSTTKAAEPVLGEETVVQICPGSDPAQVKRGTEACSKFNCNADLFSVGWKQPSLDPEYYYDCWSATVRRTVKCPIAGTCFHFGRQQCVEPSQWENSCVGQVIQAL